MKRIALFCTVMVIAAISHDLKSQNLTIGAGSGINFSDIHRVGTTGYWKPKPGPSAGLFVRWNMTPLLGLQTGLDYSTVYYEYHPYLLEEGPIIYPFYEPQLLPYPDFIMLPQIESTNHSFLTMPLELTLTIPSRPSLTLGAGMFYSIIMDQDRGDLYFTDDLSGNDHGYLFTVSVDYPVNERLSLFAGVRFVTGRKLMCEGRDYKHGYSDLMAGLSFGLGGDGAGVTEEGKGENPVNENISLTWFAGANLSWNSGNVNRDKYSVYAGPSAGFLADFRLGGSRTRFSTGLILERAGYSMRDSSNSYYLYDQPSAEVNTRISSDYVVIPALLDFHFGRDECLSISTGPWFAARLNSQCRGTAINTVSTSTSYRLREITVNDDITEVTRRNDFGWMTGAEVSLPVRGMTRINLGVQFRQGIPEILNLDNAGIDESEKDVYVRNSVLTLRAGVTVPVYKTGR
ncbi:MAG: outer membrane beta-barrel protein [Bacteroidales bacterium]|nr:outer membrane beta-barrel protein [Bacteroidales bacterium]MCB9028833.1 outer membrane beta-barrel protein [Bacteroidales bacterium]MDD3737299.1 outer membrane beta-barrel protein [Bacteroidales bacterium]NLD62779.1 outer membrane beta-barrel protein [Bacteroidales bacterium]HNT92711.1 outer membrane beta-barrel protein [Bacteroidales bacterium]